MVKLFVGNLSVKVTHDELRPLFEKYGKVRECDIVNNFAFVHMEEMDAAQRAVVELHKSDFQGSKLTVEYSTSRARNAVKIFVGHVDPSVTPGQLKEMFEKYGNVVECATVNDYAFVHMDRPKSALSAIEALNGTQLAGRKLRIEMSRSNQVPPGDGAGGHYDERPFLPPHSPLHPHPSHHHHPPAPAGYGPTDV